MKTAAPDLPLPEELDIDYLVELEIEWRRREAFDARMREYRVARARDDIAFHRHNIAARGKRMAAKAADKRMEQRMLDTQNAWLIEHGYPPLPRK